MNTMVSRKLGADNKIKLMQHWYRWFHDHTDNWADIGTDVAFLLGAILNDGVIHVNSKSKLRALLIRKNIPENDQIWSYMNFYDKYN